VPSSWQVCEPVTPLQAVQTFFFPGVQPSSDALLIVQFVTKKLTLTTPTKSFHIERLLFIE